MISIDQEVPPDVLRDIIEKANPPKGYYAWRFVTTGQLCNTCVRDKSQRIRDVAQAHNYEGYPFFIQDLFAGYIVRVDE